MKLNLLPAGSDKSSKVKFAFLGSLLLFILSLVGAFLMAREAQRRVDLVNQKLEEVKPHYDNVVKIAADADAVMARPQVREAVVNAGLAQAMNKANTLYPDVYDFVRPYIPRFFRITSMIATPVDATNSTVTMTGTVKNAQEYADLMLSLLRIPGSTSVSRGGFSAEDVVVPRLTAVDQYGKPRKESQAPIPDDAYERLAYFEGQQAPSGYLASGGFGVTEAGTTKTVRPGESLITVTVSIPRNLQVPNPRATIQSLGGAAPAGGGAAPAASRGPAAFGPPAGAIPGGGAAVAPPRGGPAPGAGPNDQN
jgi:Tfp pilus assembly protein PilN